MKIITVAAFITLIGALTSCERHAPSSAAPLEARKLPTASEVFQLRSECARLAEKILDDNVVGSALTQSQTSHYNEETNRCYVELTVQSADLTTPQEIMRRYLFDGQTKELLATSAIEKGVKHGLAYKSAGVSGFDEANEYINEKMADSQQ